MEDQVCYSPTTSWSLSSLKDTDLLKSLFPCKRLDSNGTRWASSNHCNSFDSSH